MFPMVKISLLAGVTVFLCLMQVKKKEHFCAGNLNLNTDVVCTMIWWQINDAHADKNQNVAQEIIAFYNNIIPQMPEDNLLRKGFEIGKEMMTTSVSWSLFVFGVISLRISFNLLSDIIDWIICEWFQAIDFDF